MRSEVAFCSLSSKSAADLPLHTRARKPFAAEPRFTFNGVPRAAAETQLQPQHLNILTRKNYPCLRDYVTYPGKFTTTNLKNILHFLFFWDPATRSAQLWTAACGEALHALDPDVAPGASQQPHRCKPLSCKESPQILTVAQSEVMLKYCYRGYYDSESPSSREEPGEDGCCGPLDTRAMRERARSPKT